MSSISCDLREGRTDEQKRALAAGLIEAVGSDPAIINVVIHELTPANVSVGGHIHRG
jgi:4-oxalocrotonate tautomerase family enzyme